MSFTFTNYPILTPEQQNPMNALVTNALKNYQNTVKTAYLKPGLEEELKKNKLYNQYYGPDKQSQIDLRGSQTGYYGAQTQGKNIENQYAPEKYAAEARKRKFIEENPGIDAPGITGQIARYNYMKKHGQLPDFGGQEINPQMQNNLPDEGSNESFMPTNPITAWHQNQQPLQMQRDPILDSILKTNGSKAKTQLENAQDYRDRLVNSGADEKQIALADAQIEKAAHGVRHETSTALEKHREKTLLRKHWDSLPPDSKAQIVAIGQGAGLRADEVEKALSSGQSLDSLLYDQGYDKENPPEPIYQLTGANRTALTNREAASRETRYLSNFITNATGEYANNISGYSTKQISDSLSGRNEHQQARFLAARGLSPELINMRLLLSGSKSTVAAQEAMKDKSLLNLKAFQTLVKPKVWAETQKIMDHELDQAFKSSKKGLGQPAPKNSDSKRPDFKSMSDEELAAYLER
jgi:hypothetical protein